MTRTIVCPLCVQLRCAKNHGDCDLDEMTCATEHGFEPYWPDGSIATITQNEYCERCTEALAEYEARSAAGEM